MNTTDSKALYYNINLEAKELDILQRHADGTIDLGTGDTVVVRRCQVSKFAKGGFASLGSELAEPEPPRVGKVREATPDEIREEMRTNLRAANDWWQAKTLIEHRLAEHADIVRRFESTLEFRSLAEPVAR